MYAYVNNEKYTKINFMYILYTYFYLKTRVAKKTIISVFVKMDSVPLRK